MCIRVPGHGCVRSPTWPPALRLSGHWERWDGDGYPDGLAGRDIPLNARIFAVCDVYDALISERPYKRAWTHEDAAAEIEQQSGQQFDPEVVRVFLDLIRRATE